MKYIRTANNIYKRDERYNEIVNGYIACIKGVYVQEKAVINQADTIEELCDGFVCARTPSTGKVFREVFERIDREHHADDEFCRLINYRGDEPPDRQGIALEEVKNGVYGSIWVDGSLIKVAQMNEKGELELL